MAVGYTLELQYMDVVNKGTSGDPYITSSFTPTAGRVLYVVIGSQRSSGGQDPDTITGLSGTFTKLSSSAVFNAGLSKMSVWRCTDYTGTGALTITYLSTQSCCCVLAFTASGSAGTTPTNVVNGSSDGQVNGYTLSGLTTPTAANAVFGAICTYDDNQINVVPGADFTEIGEADSGDAQSGSDSANNQAQIDPGSADTSVEWTWTGTLDVGAVAWEEPASGAAPTPPLLVMAARVAPESRP